MSKAIFLSTVILFALVLLTNRNGTLSPANATVAGYQVVVGETAVDNSPTKQLKVNCPAGTKAFGAGWAVLDPTGAILEGRATYFEPAFDGSHWLVNARKESTFSPKWKLRVRVTCA